MKDLQLNGALESRGRNGWFRAQQIVLWQNEFGVVTIAVDGTRATNIYVKLTAEEARQLARLLLEEVQQ